MELINFPNCCTAVILVGLGRSATAANGWRHPEPETPENFFMYGKRMIEEAGRRNMATIIAITNSDQRTAINTLPKLGFQKVQDDLAKRQHADTKLATWVYTVCDEDRVPLRVPANPFAKEEEPAVPVPIPQPARDVENPLPRGNAIMHPQDWLRTQLLAREGMVVPMNWTVMDVRVYQNHYNRKDRNSRLRIQNSRDENGRFRRLPVRGIPYTLEELRQVYVPADMRYLRIFAHYYGLHAHRSVRAISCRQGVSQMGLSNPAATNNDLFVFA